MEEQRVAIKFCVKAGKSAVEMIELINKVYGSAAMSCAIVYPWYARFRNGREDVKDNARSGRPSTARTEENVEYVRRLLTEDLRTTLQMIADLLNIGKETVRQIVTEDLGKRRICARFVPHALTTEQKQERVVYCQDLLLMGQDECFGENIITGDETWCFAYDPATKRLCLQPHTVPSPHTVHVSNPCPCLAVPIAAHSRFSINSTRF